MGWMRILQRRQFSPDFTLLCLSLAANAAGRADVECMQWNNGRVGFSRYAAPATPSPKTHSQEELWRLSSMASQFSPVTRVPAVTDAASHLAA